MSASSRILAVDLGGTRLRAAVSPEPGTPIALDIAHGASAERPLAVEQLIAALRTVVADDLLDAIGVSVAGTVEPERGLVVVSDNLGWEDVPLAQSLATAFAVPVFVDTDTFCGARAEARWGGARPAATLYVAIGTGIGHAWVLNGELWRGVQGAANLFGHLIVRPGGRLCYCGNRGCLCQYAAGPVVGPALTKPDRPESAATLVEADDVLALAVAHALTMMNPAEVILGGGIGDIWPEPRALEARVAAMAHPQVRPIRIRRSTLGAQANMIGARVLAANGIAAIRDNVTKQED